MRSLVKLAIGAVGVVALGIVAILFLRSGGERAKIEAMLTQAVADANAGEAEKCIAYISTDYRDPDGTDYARVCGQVRYYVGPGKWKSVSLQRMEVEVTEDTAAVDLRLLLEGGDLREFMQQRFPLRLHLSLKKTDAGWKITGHEVLQR
jgi:hypothetical protein